MPHRDWIDFLEAFGPIFAVVVALLIGITQWWLQKRQLKQDLFNKRLKVYLGVQNYVTSLLRDDEEKDRFASYRQFRSETDPGEFLFGKDVWAYIESIGDAGTRFRTAETQMNAYSITLQAPGTSINSDDQQRRTEAANRYDQAQQNQEKLMKLITQAFEGGIKSMFARDLQL